MRIILLPSSFSIRILNTSVNQWQINSDLRLSATGCYIISDRRLLTDLHLDQSVKNGIGNDRNEWLNLTRKKASKNERARRVTFGTILVTLKEAQVNPANEAALGQHDDIGESREPNQIQDAADKNQETG